MTSQTGRIIAVGDIHGCFLALDTLLEAIAPQPEDELVLLGDVIDQGSESRAVLERLLQLESQCRLVCLRGNHEELLLAALESDQACRFWEACGGSRTLNSYRFGARIDEIPATHLDFIRRCRESYETDDFIFAHAGVDPDLPLDSQPGYTLRWQLLEPGDDLRPHVSGKTVIVGHTEQTSGEILDLGFIKCLDTACWRYGWLTAMDVERGTNWQAQRFGVLREAHESPVGPINGVRNR